MTQPWGPAVAAGSNSVSKGVRENPGWPRNERKHQLMEALNRAFYTGGHTDIEGF